METDLLHKTCVACEGGTAPLTGPEIDVYRTQIDAAWEVEGEKKIRRKFTFKNFKETMAFANRVADIAESEGHHPDLHISYGSATVELWTHAIGGLSVNDFIMVAKIDQLH